MDPFRLRATLLLDGILSDIAEIRSTGERLDASDESATQVGILRLRAIGRFAPARVSLRMTDV